VRIAVRPENTRLKASDAISARPDRNALDGRISGLRYQGTQTRVVKKLKALENAVD